MKTKLTIFSVVVLVLLSSYLTRELLPRKVVSVGSAATTVTLREGPPPRLEFAFKNTDVLNLLEKKKGLIGQLQNQVDELHKKLTTRQALKPDTVYIHDTVLPREAIKRGIMHLRIQNGLFAADMFDLTDSTAILTSWKRGGVENDVEVWALQDPDLPAQQWIRLDEDRNTADLILLSPGYSMKDGLFLDFGKFRVWKLHGKGRGLEDGIHGELWIDWGRVL